MAERSALGLASNLGLSIPTRKTECFPQGLLWGSAETMGVERVAQRLAGEGPSAVPADTAATEDRDSPDAKAQLQGPNLDLGERYGSGQEQRYKPVAT